jgi:CheY-like chemotaxis protein
MNIFPLNLLLADDDMDDCIFFKDALEELPLSAKLTTVNDGVQLMQLLSKKEVLPYVLYLDLNMPRKNGFDCLAEIKMDEKLKQLPVIIFSTSSDKDVINYLYEKGAHFYIRKPAEFSNLKMVIQKSLELIVETNKQHPARENFVLNVS